MVKSCCMTKLSLTLKHWLKSIMGTLRKNFINKHQTTKQKQPVIARAPQHPMHQPKANFIFNTRHLKNAHIYIAEVSKNILKLLIQVRVYYSQTFVSYFVFPVHMHVQCTIHLQEATRPFHFSPPPPLLIFYIHLTYRKKYEFAINNTSNFKNLFNNSQFVLDTR